MLVKCYSKIDKKEIAFWGADWLEIPKIKIFMKLCSSSLTGFLKYFLNKYNYVFVITSNDLSLKTDNLRINDYEENIDII